MSSFWRLTTPTATVARVAPRETAQSGRAEANSGLLRLVATASRPVLLAAELQSWPAASADGDIAALDRLRQPIVGTLRGRADALAVRRLMAVDVRVASDDFRVDVAEPGGDVLSDKMAISRLARLVGPGIASYWILTRRTVHADEAYDRGLVHVVASGSQLEEVALGLASGIGAGAPLALEYAKEAIRRGASLSLGEAMDVEADLYSLLQNTEDRSEGVAAFLERRDPAFRGR